MIFNFYLGGAGWIAMARRIRLCACNELILMALYLCVTSAGVTGMARSR